MIDSSVLQSGGRDPSLGFSQSLLQLGSRMFFLFEAAFMSLIDDVTILLGGGG